MTKLMWISWEKHRRTDEICDYLGITPTVLLTQKKSVARYIYLVKQTVKVISKKKPSTLIVQNPSVVLATLATLIRPFYKYRLIVDAHNEAIEPYAHNNLFFRVVARMLMRFADATIITNRYLADIVESNGGNAVILPDRLPRTKDVPAVNMESNTFNAVLIATYAADEPIKEIISAASDLKGKLTLFVTGNYAKLGEDYVNSLPDNIVFTGFLDEDSYWGYLKGAHAIIDLSLKDNCLVCGAYEGAAVKKPMMLSNSKATVDYFNKGVSYTDNSTRDIERAFNDLIDNYKLYEHEVDELNSDMDKGWFKMAENLNRTLERID